MAADTYVLIVDDEPFNLEILEEYLVDAGYLLLKAEDGAEALSQLHHFGDRIDVVLLDRMMPTMNGMEVLAHIKATPAWAQIPVVLQTAVGSADAVREGLMAGAYYYLTKPYDRSILLAVVAAAVQERRDARRLAEAITRQQACIRLMWEGRFQLRTLDEAYDVATLVSSSFPDPQRVAMGLTELIVNGIEHGNLGIRYVDKGRLLREATWQEEVARRLNLPEFAARKVEVYFIRDEREVKVLIRDDGDGFDWKPFLELSPERAFDPHGRGISMARMISFDRLEYRGKGNEVEVAVNLEK